VVNVGGYYDPLLAQLDRAAEQGFLLSAHRQLLISDADSAALLDRFADYQPPTVEKWITRSDT
jgi:predicted Rossmann-fold nucleotide-binding protein